MAAITNPPQVTPCWIWSRRRRGYSELAYHSPQGWGFFFFFFSIVQKEKKNKLLMAKTLTSKSAADNKVNKWVTSGNTGSRQGQPILRSEPPNRTRGILGDWAHVDETHLCWDLTGHFYRDLDTSIINKRNAALLGFAETCRRWWHRHALLWVFLPGFTNTPRRDTHTHTHADMQFSSVG